MNEVSIHGSYIFGINKIHKIDIEDRDTEELGSKRGQIEGPTKNQRGKTNSQ